MSTETEKTAVDYRQVASAFSRLIKEVLTHCQRQFVPGVKKQNGLEFIKTLTPHFDTYVQSIFDNGVEDKLMEGELGDLFGALVAHLEAVNSRWNVYHDAKNKHINVEEKSRECFYEATSIAHGIALKGARLIAQLMQHEAELLARANILCALIEGHCHRYDLRPNVVSQVHGVSVATLTRTRLYIKCSYCYGQECGDCSVGYVFKTPERRKQLLKFGLHAFGDEVKFDDKFEYILLHKPVIEL